MFDRYVFTENSCRNVEEDGKMTGFELETLITYYRGVPLSMVYGVSLAVDGIPIPREMIRVSLDRDVWFTLSEAETATSYKWEYGEPMFVRALVEGGLRKGEHEVKLFVAVYPAYYPFPAGGERTRNVLIK
jgi:hypothetical protein